MKEFSWKEYSWAFLILFCGMFALWYLIYCLRICKPHRKLTLFAQSIDKPLDTELAGVIAIRCLTIIGAVFTSFISIVYSITNEWLLPSVPFGNRLAIAAGAIYLMFLTLKSSIGAIHNYLQKVKQNPVDTNLNKPNKNSGEE